MIGLQDFARFCRRKSVYKQRNNITKAGLFGYEQARNQKSRTRFGLYQTQNKERQRKVGTPFNCQAVQILSLKSDVSMSDFVFLKNSNLPKKFNF